MDKAKRLITDFVEERLRGNLSELARFDFAQLRGDKKYGACGCGNFDCDNTILANAVYLLVFDDVWSGMGRETLENGLYRGDTINTFNTTFGKPTAMGGFAGINRFEPSEELQQRVQNFHSSYHTIGNFMVLPNACVDGHTLNSFRGTFYQWRDYIDRFVGALHQQLTELQDCDNEILCQLMVANAKDFELYRSQEGFESLMGKLLLEDCIDNNGKPKRLFDVIYHWNKNLPRERYFNHVKQYLDFSESFIAKRGAKIVKILASKIG